MANTSTESTTLRVTHSYAASRDDVFRAWTDPEQLKKWWGHDGWSTPIAEVDLRVGGSYRLGMLNPDAEGPYVCGGTYKEVTPPEKLVYTWKWEHAPEDAPSTLVTVEFVEQGDSTEVVLVHEQLADEEDRDKHGEGWKALLDHLAKLF